MGADHPCSGLGSLLLSCYRLYRFLLKILHIQYSTILLDCPFWEETTMLRQFLEIRMLIDHSCSVLGFCILSSASTCPWETWFSKFPFWGFWGRMANFLHLLPAAMALHDDHFHSENRVSYCPVPRIRICTFAHGTWPWRWPIANCFSVSGHLHLKYVWFFALGSFMTFPGYLEVSGHCQFCR